jgi:hypothetical protein
MGLSGSERPCLHRSTAKSSPIRQFARTSSGGITHDRHDYFDEKKAALTYPTGQAWPALQ